MVDARSDGRLMAKVARQVDQLDAIVLAVELTDQIGRRIAAPVVDQNEFPLIPRRVQRRGHAAAQLW
jgi:hypothetical protein